MMDRRLDKAKQTPFGTLYAPQPTLVQLLTLLGGIFGCYLGAQIVIWALGGLSEFAEIAVYVAFGAVLVLGYSLWTARLSAIAFQAIGKGVLKALFLSFVRRRKPDSLEELLPTEERLTAMAVAAQKAASSFATAGIVCAVIAAPVSLLFEAQASAVARFVVVAICLVAWGAALAFLGRRGYLPIMEGD